MSRKDPTTIGPAPYAAWRATSLGAITEAIEQGLILDMIGKIAGARVLDVGCGDGALVCVMASRGAEATGVDPDPAMLAAARSRAASEGVRAAFVEGRVERLPFPDASFDVVFSVTVLCFTRDAASSVRELARVLRPGGRLVLGELGRWSLWAALRRVRGWLGAETWKAARFRGASELRSLAEQAGLSVTAIRGAVYYPPVGAFARALAPIDSRLGRLTTFGAAFIALGAVSVDQPWKQ
ncbi:class I SAM-dependent methyltransferase [Rhodoblastus sp. 17X3]|uniref:class I SAM-dependent methyltransferase n=1 Tax=Rhodoblastus sp. 17X3 TaxID=3047026 RepID=UPI0024B82CBA|nr:class I SAM-dependent methyltransferase [Rhodoblastus sp. 17X3]MDI9847076.1 class I SAM-dependent methyltransferase [Rhodoblastus sp. 17X3]